MQMAVINKLGKIAAVSLFACCSSYYLFQHSLSKALLSSEFCKDAIQLVNDHNGAKLFLGEPIEALNAKFLSHGKDPVKSIQIVVSGPKSKGKVFIAVSKVEEKRLQLDSVQLQIGKDDSKRLEIKSKVSSSS